MFNRAYARTKTDNLSAARRRRDIVQTLDWFFRQRAARFIQGDAAVTTCSAAVSAPGRDRLLRVEF